MREAERLSEHTKRLPPLAVGDFVHIQNQTGPHPLKWDKTGIVIEVRQFDQYVIKVDGSGRVTLGNRKFLRKYTPVLIPPSKRTIEHDINVQKHLPHQMAAPGTPTSAHTPLATPNVPPIQALQDRQALTSPHGVDAPTSPGVVASPYRDIDMLHRQLSFDDNQAYSRPVAQVPGTTPSKSPIRSPPMVTSPTGPKLTPQLDVQLRRSSQDIQAPGWHAD